MDCKYSVLDTQNSIPTYCFKEARKIWVENCLVIPEYTFAARMNTTILLYLNHNMNILTLMFLI